MKKLFITPFILFLLFSCAKKKTNPFPDFPKDESAALTNPVSLPFNDSINYGATVATYSIPPGWLEAIVTGAKTDRGWAYRPGYGLTAGANDGAMIASAYGGNNGSDNTYLIVGPFNLADYSSLKMSFDFRLEYDTDPGAISFEYSNNYSGSGDPLAPGVSWTPINEINAQLPATSCPYTNISAQLNIPSNNVFLGLLNGLVGKFQFAFSQKLSMR